MIYIRGDGEPLRYGIGIYPWRERKRSIGFVLKFWRDKALMIRWSPRFRYLTVSRGRKI